MKRLFGMLALSFASMMALAADKPLFSSTIDFLDYAMVHGDPKAGYYKLEDYEAALRNMAEGGIKKIYLRVNICGTTHYPSEVSAMYGDNNAYHWFTPQESMYVINTYKHYNPCLETIRIGHKYGMEVWGWESLYDDAGVQYGRGGIEGLEKTYEWLDGWALMDPWYIDNMDAFAMRDPLLVQKKRAAAALYASDKRKPVGRIVFTNDPMWKDRKPPRIRSGKDLLLYVSDDNKRYRPYEGDYEVTPSVTEDGLNRLVITGLALKEKYVKLAVRGMPMDRDYTMVLTKDVGQCQIYDTDGKELPSVWGIVHNGEELVEQQIFSSLNFAFYVPNTPSASCALDYGNRAVGFSVGEPDMSDRDLYYYGVAEFTVPKTMEHKVQRFVELARYAFDGFMFNTRCHSGGGNGVEFGYNPEVLEKFKARHGHDYNGSQEDIAGVFQIRADSIAEFFRRCKAESGGRPIYFSAMRPPEMKDEPDYNATFGPMPWPYKKMFAEGSIDGVMMSGPNFRNGREFSDYFTKEITGGRDVKIGLFREMGCGIPKNYDFAADMQVAVDKGLDEVELYESLCITDGLGEAFVYPTIKKIAGE